MNLPVVIEPLPEHRGFTAHLAAPFNISAEAASAEEAYKRLAELVQRRLEQGTEIRSITIPVAASSATQPGWLPDDELTREWVEQVEAYRVECDAADRSRLHADPQVGESME